MSSYNLDVYMPVLILMAFALIMVFGALLVGMLIRPHNPTELKQTPYECGEEPIGTAWSNFNVRFYVVALIFLIFDVEGALMFPVASVFKKFNEIGLGGAVLGSFLLFITILFAGVVYCWKKGDLDWVRSYQVNETATQED
ncbi:NADH-quinone oxidoreductase subunit A [Halobacteriovorax sp. GB3]|uniref:NADH-quinone oxidoreductase subunit A n=1 Tax=Halobacteriovorax sp. GB3 TaxID=2719615 RepID=UPI0023613CB5|nr:NADH-quinone oxidoreductase subunit A [Halobacteriovorax sp. GB3]MDD0854706.1 NADH-quinone oxidoreductase subunit A [Halobacteriovorax sp. GB3]